MKRNIVLIGFMGTGKSTIGQALSRALGYPHLDSDELLVKKVGKSIPAIFAEEGEGAFRGYERQVLKELGNRQHVVISTGGGILNGGVNSDAVRSLGYVVCLEASPEVILERTSRNKNRPLLQGPDPFRTIQELLAQRSKHYREAAHLVLDTEGLSQTEIVAGILDCARYRLAKEDQ